MKNSFDVFDFNEEDEHAEFTAGKLLGKFQNPNPDDSPSLKYQFLQNSSQGNGIRKEEMENVRCVDVDAVDNRCCDDACTFATEPETSMMDSARKLKLKTMDQERDVGRDNHESRRFSLELGSKNCFREILSPSQSQLNCSLSNSPSSHEQVDMMSADDGSLSGHSTSTLASDIAEDDDLLKVWAANHCFSDGEMDDINATVTMSPDYVVLRDMYCTAPLLTFSSSGVKVKGSTTSDEGPFTYEWRVEEIVNIEYNWFKKVSLVILKLRVLLKDEKQAEGMQGASDIEEVKIAIVEQNWPEKQGKINSLNVKYPAVWNSILDGNTGVTGDNLSQPRHYFPTFNEHFEDVIYPKGDPDAVSICKRDVDLLQPETFVNDTIIDFYIKYLKNHIQPEEKHRFHFFNSFFFRKLADLDKDPSSIADGKAAFLRVRKWTRKVDIFGKDYIFIPVNFNLHWSLIVICHPGEVASRDENLDNSLKVPCILHMDSIRGSHAGLKNLFQSYLCEEWKERHKEASEEFSSKFLNLRFVSLELPQQENSFDCGLFLLHYLELFLTEAPLHFSPFKITMVSNFLNVDWFPPAEASLKRTLIQKLIFELLENHSSKASSDENHSSECPMKNENDTGVEVLSERCSPSNVCHTNLSGPLDGQGIEMTLLERSSMRNLHGVSDSGLVLRELFDSGATAGSLLGQYQPFENASQFYQLNNLISPREKVDAETGEQLFCFASGESNFQQMSEMTAAGCTLSFSSRCFDTEASWNLGISMQEEHEADSTSETSSGCASDDSEDVGIIENNQVEETGLNRDERSSELSPVKNTASLSIHPTSASTELPAESLCNAEENHSIVPTNQDHSIVPINQDADDADENGSTQDSEMVENKSENVEGVNTDDRLLIDVDEERARKRLRLTAEG